ncbi:MAG TPA: hydrogenase maturation protease [Streptosporangiaceae bacterium]|nr:hydrogenase maturation protease [Streptosporangiaceae bacterium]
MTGPAAPDGNAVVIGIGNEFRRDDGAGPAVLARLHGRVPRGVELLVSDGEPAGLIEAWAGAPLAVIVDAVRAEPSVPGRLHRLVLHQAGAAEVRTVSSHGLGLDSAIGLAQALDRMPGTLILHAVEAADLGQGPGLTPAVAAVIDTLADAILRDLNGQGSKPG